MAEHLEPLGVALRELKAEQGEFEEIFPEPSPQEKGEIDAKLGPDFAKQVRESIPKSE